jgi:predicted esterase
MLTLSVNGPHNGQPVLTSGTPLSSATTAMILVHGRGATADSMLTLGDVLPHEDMAYLAPQAAGHTWYPNRFLAPLMSNEPWLSSALSAIDDLLRQIAAAGIPAERTVLLGFSQGGCLALEYAVRHPRRYGGLIGLSAGLIGPAGTTWPESGSFEGTPAFLGCSDVDVHVPAARVHESTAVLQRLRAIVTTVIYPGMDHTVTAEELAQVQAILSRL